MTSEFGERLQAALEREIATHRVNGAAVGVVQAGRVTIATSGVADRSTGVRVTARTPFLIGSIAKTWTATIVMRLFDEWHVDLDEPVRTYVPELSLGSELATETLTLRHLLTHSCGIDEDTTIADEDSSDSCLAAYVANLARIGQIHDPGAQFSYSNSGFVLLGLVAERLTGRRFDDLVVECLIEPLAIDAAMIVPGRTRSGDGRDAIATGYGFGWRSQHVAVNDRLPRAYGPAGSSVAASVADVLRFAEVHLAGSADYGAHVVLPAAARDEMHRPQRRLPWASTIDEGSVCLGWMRTRIGRADALYHGGGNLGQQCGLVVVPSSDLALTILTNAHSCPGLHAAIIDLVLSECVDPDARFAPTQMVCGEPTIDPAHFVGDYRRRSLAVRVTEAGGRLRCRVVSRSRDVRLGTGESPVIAMLQRLFSAGLHPCRDNVFVASSRGRAGSTGTPFVFSRRKDEPSVGHLTIGYSALRRTSL